MSDQLTPAEAELAETLAARMAHEAADQTPTTDPARPPWKFHAEISSSVDAEPLMERLSQQITAVDPDATVWATSSPFDGPTTDPAPLDLAAIEGRANTATPGPWGAYWGNRIGRGVEILGDGSGSLVSATQDVAEIPDDRCDWDDEDAVEVSSEADAEFIAHARQDVPALVARVRQLEAELGELRRLGEQAIGAEARAVRELEAELATARRDSAADALAWLAGSDSPLEKRKLLRPAVEKLAAEIRSGARTAPTTAEEKL